MIHVVHERECFANVPNGFRVWGDTGRASSVKISSATTRKQQLWGSLCVLLCWAMGSQRGGGNRYVEGNPSLSANLCWMMPFLPLLSAIQIKHQASSVKRQDIKRHHSQTTAVGISLRFALLGHGLAESFRERGWESVC